MILYARASKDSHCPNYTQCVEGFTIFKEFKDAIKEKDETMVKDHIYVLKKT